MWQCFSWNSSSEGSKIAIAVGQFVTLIFNCCCTFSKTYSSNRMLFDHIILNHLWLTAVRNGIYLQQERGPREILRGRPTQALPRSCWWYIILFNSIFWQRKNLEGMIIPSRFLCGGMINPSWILRGGMVKPSQFLKTVRYSIQATLSLLWLKHLPCKPPLKYQIFWKKNRETSWGWAGPSSATAGIVVRLKFVWARLKRCE